MKNGLKNLVFLLLLLSLVLSLPVLSASWWTALAAFTLDTTLITFDVLGWIRKTRSTRSLKKQVSRVKTKRSDQKVPLYFPFRRKLQMALCVGRIRRLLNNSNCG